MSGQADPSVSPLSGDEAVRRVKVALAEMGYGGDEVEWRGEYRPDGVPLLWLDWSTPDAVAWQACALGQSPLPCWSCWLMNSDDMEVHDGCLMGDCANLGPKRPPRELLVSPREEPRR